MKFSYHIVWLVIVAIPLCSWNPSAIFALELPEQVGMRKSEKYHKTVRMDLIDAHMRFGKTTFSVDAVYKFFNTGKATTELVAFEKEPFMRYDTWVNGERLTDWKSLSAWLPRISYFLRTLSTGPRSNVGWVVRRVKFPAKRPTIIRTSYTSHYYGPLEGLPVVSYPFAAGRYWKGSIQVATITIHGTDRFGSKSLWAFVLPRWRRLIRGNVIRLETRDFTPDFANGKFVFRFIPEGFY